MKLISNLFISIANYMVEVQDSCKMNSETFCNQAHQRINNELEDIQITCGLARHWLDTSSLTKRSFYR